MMVSWIWLPGQALREPIVRGGGVRSFEHLNGCCRSGAQDSIAGSFADSDGNNGDQRYSKPLGRGNDLARTTAGTVRPC